MTCFAVTVIAQLAVYPPTDAATFAEPLAIAVTIPFSTLQILGLSVVQVTVPFALDGVIVATNKAVSSSSIDKVDSFNVIPVIATSVTVIVVLAVKLLTVSVTVIVTLPVATGVTTPSETVATLVFTVNEGVSGLLFEPRSAEDMAAKIRLVMDSPELYASLSRGALREYGERFTGERFAADLEKVYKKALEMGKNGK